MGSKLRIGLLGAGRIGIAAKKSLQEGRPVKLSEIEK